MLPLGNVLEFYGGNDSKMRKIEDVRGGLTNDDHMRDLNFKDELKKLNRHMQGDYVVLNSSSKLNVNKE